jgi:DNA-binding response OmpR family regulator
MTERILVVDDDPDILEFVRINLELDGFVVETAAGGASGLEAAAANPPDLMLLDIMMPEIDGLTG